MSFAPEKVASAEAGAVNLHDTQERLVAQRCMKRGTLLLQIFLIFAFGLVIFVILAMEHHRPALTMAMLPAEVSLDPAAATSTELELSPSSGRELIIAKSWDGPKTVALVNRQQEPTSYAQLAMVSAAGWMKKHPVQVIGGTLGVLNFANSVKGCVDSSQSGGGFDIYACAAAMISTIIAVLGGIWKAASAFGTWVGNEMETELQGIRIAPREAEATLSAHLGIEVRHIGEWTPSADDNHLITRDEDDAPWPVFGMNLQGLDYHFTLQHDGQNQTNFRLGKGPGPDTKANRRLRARLDKGVTFHGPVNPWNQGYFGEGGIDFRTQYYPDDNDPQTAVVYHEDFEALNRQVSCFLRKWHSELGDDYDYGAAQFLVKNRVRDTIISSSVIAPFEVEGRSDINEVDIAEDIDIDEECTAMSGI